MSFLTRRPSVEARRGMVATSETQAAMAGLRVLQDGGNAVDAAVATSAALCVTEPMSTGLGGDMFALTWSAKGPEGNGAKRERAFGEKGIAGGAGKRGVQRDASSGGTLGDGSGDRGWVADAVEEAREHASVKATETGYQLCC